MSTKTYTHRVIISRPDEIPPDADHDKCSPLGVYVLFESDLQAQNYLLQFVGEKSAVGFAPSLVHEQEYTLFRRYGPDPADAVTLRIWVEPLPTAIVVPSTTVEEVREWFRSLHPERA